LPDKERRRRSARQHAKQASHKSVKSGDMRGGFTPCRTAARNCGAFQAVLKNPRERPRRKTWFSANTVKYGDMRGGFYSLQDRRPELRSNSGGPEKPA
jgi:hypothetical protein